MVPHMKQNEIVITRTDIVLRSIAGREFHIGKIHYAAIRKAITMSNRLNKANKHSIKQIKIDM